MSTESPVQKDERNAVEQDAVRTETEEPAEKADLIPAEANETTAPADAAPEPAEEQDSRPGISEEVSEPMQAPHPTQDAAPLETAQAEAEQQTEAVEEAAPIEQAVPAAQVAARAAPAEESAATQAVPAAQSTSFATRCFGGLSVLGPLTLFVLWLIQSLPTLMGRELHALHDLGNALTGNAAAGLPSPELYPIAHWFISGLSRIPGLDALSLTPYLPGVQPTAGLEQISGYPVALLPLASALSALFLILLTWALARATGNDRRTALASGLVVLTSLAFIGLPRLSGSDLLFTSILTLGGLCLYRGWIKPSAPLWLFSGFMLVTLSTLAGGLLGLALPLLTSLVFLLWRGTFRRAGARDGALGFGLMLVLLMTWGTLVAFDDGGRELLRALLEDEYLAPIREACALQGQDAWISPTLLAIIWLPWTLLVLFLPWGRIGTFLKALVTNRTQRPGQGWLWCCVLVTLAVLSLLGADMPVLLLPLVPPLAVLTAQALRALSAGASRGFFLLLSLLFIVLGLLFAAASLYPALLGEVPAQLAALQTALPLVPALVQSLGLLLLGLLLWKAVNRACAEGALLVLTFLLLVYAAPLAYYTGTAERPTAPAQTQSAQPAPASLPAPGLTPAEIPATAPEQMPAEQAAPQAPGTPAAPVAPAEAPATQEPQPAPAQ